MNSGKRKKYCSLTFKDKGLERGLSFSKKTNVALLQALCLKELWKKKGFSEALNLVHPHSSPLLPYLHILPILPHQKGFCRL